MPLRFTLRQLEYFVAVGEAGSIALAAERVHVSSPSISTAIGQLEAELGLSLFVRRHAQGLALTQAGRQVMDQARQVLREAEALTRLASDVTGAVQGPLALGCLLTFAQLVVPALRRGFELRYPAVRMRQTELNQQQIFEALRSGVLDVALTYDLELPEDLRFAPLATLPPYVLMPEAHPLAGRGSLTVEDLADHPMVLLDLPLSADYFLSFFRAAGVKPMIAERTRDMAVMQSLVGNGFGYSIANSRPPNDLSPDGHRLCCVPLVGKVRPMVVGLLAAEGADSVLTVRRFIEHCREVVGGEGLPGMSVRPTSPARPGEA
ncbi:LysR family transcriptional regulator [Defluviimonas sp. WL0075]|uniref:LysR family transcriptional regulator n=1 Tax=Albidovulum sediminicola TaxID=2984331 RepID=A0ABT2YXZ0_9RHOB|nr:LysR family transcriptional regulator [Defluviimonas sp. WL0075]MCV2863745.1 LysR family transcriptional regulator [Defluviimonas sp. WL0075]